jgi:translocation and assembly module TamB
LDGGRIPLGNPQACDLAGRLSLKAQAKPGPLAEEFMILLTEVRTILGQGMLARITNQSGAWLSIDDDNVEFRAVGGRVYHRGLTFTLGGTPVTTHGSVGFDETLALVAEIPVQAKVLGIDLSLGALEGTTIQIPIEGTLSSPRLDRRALQELPGKMLKNTARGALINGVQKQLDKLLPLQP